MFKLIRKYRQEAHDLHHGTYSGDVTWRHAILETIFRPETKIPGKSPLSHLHPDIDKLHLPEHVKIADWRKYRVEDHPALVNFQKRCHAAGLHDPWLRNYAYSFYPNMVGTRSVTALVLEGSLFGLICASVLFAARTIYTSYYPIDYIHTKEGGEHGHGGHH